MRAWVCHRLSDDRSGLSFERDWAEPPAPGRGEVGVAIRAAALNYPDLLMLSGGYQFRPELPFIPGTEAAGVVTAVGEGVDPAWLGHLVALGARTGCLAERITVPAAAIVAAPAGYAVEETASYAVGGMTAYVGLVERGRLAPGETVLVLGAGGGMGLAAVAIGNALGARVIAAASDDAKLAAARAAGADDVVRVDRAAPDFAALRDAVDIVFDPVAGPLLAPAMRTLRWRGRYLLIGFVGGMPAPFETNDALLKGIEIVGVRAGEYGRRDAAAGHRVRVAVDALAASGAYRPLIGGRWPLDRADAAFAAMAAGTLVGKAVLRVDALA
jgi:NADPH2:quinone reductase